MNTLEFGDNSNNEKLRNACEKIMNDTILSRLNEKDNGRNIASFLENKYNNTMSYLINLTTFNFRRDDDLVITVKENNEDVEYNNLLNFINMSGNYFNAINSLSDYISKCANIYNLISPNTDKFPDDVKIGASFKKEIDSVIAKKLMALPNLIPNYKKKILVRYPNNQGDQNDIIIIVPGSADEGQCIERVNKLIQLISSGNIELQKIKYIIFSGRGNNYGMEIKEDSVRFFKKANPQEKNSDEIKLAMANTVENNKTPESNLDKTFFKTEAYLMAEMFVNYMYANHEHKDILKTGNIVSKIRLESMALDTAANFILAPYSISYGIETNIENNEINIEVTHDKNPLDISAILNQMYTSHLHVISNDFHILRCMITCLQTLRPYPLSGQQFGDVTFHSCETENPLLAENYFSSSYQPNFQIFFERDDSPNIYLNKNDKSGITKKPIEESDPIKLHNYYLFRLILDHGYYSDASRPLVKIFINRLNTLYKIFDSHSNNNMVIPVNSPVNNPVNSTDGSVKDPESLVNGSANGSANGPESSPVNNSVSGGYRIMVTHKNKKNKSHKRLNVSVKKLKKKPLK
jgi:hypothetical protein